MFGIRDLTWDFARNIWDWRLRLRFGICGLRLRFSFSKIWYFALWDLIPDLPATSVGLHCCWWRSSVCAAVVGGTWVSSVPKVEPHIQQVPWDGTARLHWADLKGGRSSRQGVQHRTGNCLLLPHKSSSLCDGYITIRLRIDGRSTSVRPGFFLVRIPRIFAQ